MQVEQYQPCRHGNRTADIGSTSSQQISQVCSSALNCIVVGTAGFGCASLKTTAAGLQKATLPGALFTAEAFGFVRPAQQLPPALPLRPLLHLFFMTGSL